jgi:NDP-sugar pyrophosphorylase family protein
MNSNTNNEKRFEEFQDSMKNALVSGDTTQGLKIIKHYIKNEIADKNSLLKIKDITKVCGKFLSGLKIEGYEGDFPTFIEPVSLTPGVKIGDTVLLGPNVIIGKSCELGTFCELGNTILFDNVKLGKLCKLKWCIVDDNITLPEKYDAKECFITKNENDELDVIQL